MEDLLTPINNPVVPGSNETAKERRLAAKARQKQDSFGVATNYLTTEAPKQPEIELDQDWISAQDVFRSVVTAPSRAVYSVQSGLDGASQFLEETFDWYKDLKNAAKPLDDYLASGFEQPLVGDLSPSDLIPNILAPVTNRDYLEAERKKEEVLAKTNNLEEANSAYNRAIEQKKEDYYKQLGDQYSFLDDRNKTYIMSLVDSSIEAAGGQIVAGVAASLAAPGLGTAAWGTRLLSTIAQSAMAAGYAKKSIAAQAANDYYNQNVGQYIAEGKDLAELDAKANQLGAKASDELAAWYAFSSSLFGSVANVTSPLFSGVMGGTVKRLADVANRTQAGRIAANTLGRSAIEGIQEGIEGGIEGAIISAAKKELDGKYPGTVNDTSFLNIINEIGSDEFWDSAKEEATGGAILGALFGLPHARKRISTEYDAQQNAFTGAYRDIKNYIDKVTEFTKVEEALKNPELKEIDRKNAHQRLKELEIERTEALEIAQKSKDYADYVSGINKQKTEVFNKVFEQFADEKVLEEKDGVQKLGQALAQVLPFTLTKQEINDIVDTLPNSTGLENSAFKKKKEALKKDLNDRLNKVRSKETTITKEVEKGVKQAAKTITDVVETKIKEDRPVETASFNEGLTQEDIDSTLDALTGFVNFGAFFNDAKEGLVKIFGTDFGVTEKSVETFNQLINKLNTWKAPEVEPIEKIEPVQEEYSLEVQQALDEILATRQQEEVEAVVQENVKQEQAQQTADVVTQDLEETVVVAEGGDGGNKPPTNDYDKEFEDGRKAFTQTTFSVDDILDSLERINEESLKDDPRYNSYSDKKKKETLIKARLATFQQRLTENLDVIAEDVGKSLPENFEILLTQIFTNLEKYGVQLEVTATGLPHYSLESNTIRLPRPFFKKKYSDSKFASVFIHEAVHAILHNNPKTKKTAYTKLDEEAKELSRSLVKQLKTSSVKDSLLQDLASTDAIDDFKSLLETDFSLEDLQEFVKNNIKSLKSANYHTFSFFYGLAPEQVAATFDGIIIHELAANTIASKYLRSLALETPYKNETVGDYIRTLYRKFLNLLGFNPEQITAYDRIVDLVFEGFDQEVDIDNPSYTEGYKELEQYLLLQTIRQFKQGLWQPDVEQARRNIKGFVVDTVNRLSYNDDVAIDNLEGNLKLAFEQGKEIPDGDLSDLVDNVVDAYMNVHYLDGVEQTKESEAQRLLNLAKYKESIQAFKGIETSYIRELNKERNKINIFKFPNFNLVTPAITVRAQDKLDPSKVQTITNGLDVARRLEEDAQLNPFTLHKDGKELHLQLDNNTVANLTISPSKILELPTASSIIDAFIWYLSSKVDKDGTLQFSDIRNVQALIDKETNKAEKVVAKEIYETFGAQIDAALQSNGDITYDVVEGDRQYEYIPHLSSTIESVKGISPKNYYVGVNIFNEQTGRYELQVSYVNEKGAIVSSSSIQDFVEVKGRTIDAGTHGATISPLGSVISENVYIFQSEPNKHSPSVKVEFGFNEAVNIKEFVDYFKSDKGAEIRTKFTFVEGKPISHSTRFNVKANYKTLVEKETESVREEELANTPVEDIVEPLVEEQVDQDLIIGADGEIDVEAIFLRGFVDPPVNRSPEAFLFGVPVDTYGDTFDESFTEEPIEINEIPQSKIDEAYTKAFFEAIRYRAKHPELVQAFISKDAAIVVKTINDIREIINTSLVEILGNDYVKYKQKTKIETALSLLKRLKDESGIFTPKLSLLSSTNPINDDVDELGSNTEEVDEVEENEEGETTGGEMVDTRSVEDITNATMRDMLFHHLARTKTTENSPISQWGKSDLTITEAGNATAAILKKAVHNLILTGYEVTPANLATELSRLHSLSFRALYPEGDKSQANHSSKIEATKLVMSNLAELFSDFNTAKFSIFGNVGSIEFSGKPTEDSIVNSLTASLRQVALQLATSDSLISSLEELADQSKNGRVIGENAISKQISFNAAIVQLVNRTSSTKEAVTKELTELVEKAIEFSYTDKSKGIIDKAKLSTSIAALIARVYPNGLGIVKFVNDGTGNNKVTKDQPYLLAALESMLAGHSKTIGQIDTKEAPRPTIFLSYLVNSTYSPFVTTNALTKGSPDEKANAFFDLIQAIVENDVLVTPISTKRVIDVEGKSKPAGLTSSTQFSLEKLKSYGEELLTIDQNPTDSSKKISGNRNVFDYFRFVKVNSRNNPFSRLEFLSKENLAEGKLGYVYFPLTTLADKAVTPVFRLKNIDLAKASNLTEQFKTAANSLYNKSKKDKFETINSVFKQISTTINDPFFPSYLKSGSYLESVRKWVLQLNSSLNKFDLTQLNIGDNLINFIHDLELVTTEEDVKNLITNWETIRVSYETNLPALEAKYNIAPHIFISNKEEGSVDRVYDELGHYIRAWFYYKNNSPVTAFRNLAVDDLGNIDWTKADVDAVKRGAGQYASGLIMDLNKLVTSYKIDRDNYSSNATIDTLLKEATTVNKGKVGIVTIPDKYVKVKFSTLAVDQQTTEGTEVNYADGGGYCTPKRYCLNLLMTGAPEYEVAKIYELLTTTDQAIYDTLSAEVLSLGINFGAEKSVIHGPVLDENLVETSYKQAYYKYAAIPLPRILVQGRDDVFSKTYLAAIDKGLDYVLPTSCAKQDPIFIATPKVGEFLQNYTLATEFVEPTSVKMQIAAHIKNDNRSTLKTQFMKLANAMDNVLATNIGVEQSITDIQKRAFNTIANKAKNQSFEEAVMEFVEIPDEAQFLLNNKVPIGLSPFSVNHFKRVVTKLRKALQAEVPGSWYKQITPYALDTDIVTWFDEANQVREKNGSVIPITGLRPSTIIEVGNRKPEELLKYINERADIKQYGPVTQQQLEYYLTTYVHTFDNKVYVTLPAQVVLSGYNPALMQDIGNRQILMKRIPISGEGQIAAAEVVGTLPAYMGAVSIVDPGFLASSGSDHDGDTIYTYELKPLSEKPKPGELEKNAFVAKSIRLFTHPKIVADSNKELKSVTIDAVIKKKGLDVRARKPNSTLFSHEANRDVYFKQNHGGKDGTAIFANGCSFINSCYHAFFSQGKDPLNFVPQFQTDNIKFSNIFTLKDIEGEAITEAEVRKFYDITRTIFNEFLNAAVDGAKDPKLFFLGINNIDDCSMYTALANFNWLTKEELTNLSIEDAAVIQLTRIYEAYKQQDRSLMPNLKAYGAAIKADSDVKNISTERQKELAAAKGALEKFKTSLFKIATKTPGEAVMTYGLLDKFTLRQNLTSLWPQFFAQRDYGIVLLQEFADLKGSELSNQNIHSKKAKEADKVLEVTSYFNGLSEYISSLTGLTGIQKGAKISNFPPFVRNYLLTIQDNKRAGSAPLLDTNVQRTAAMGIAKVLMAYETQFPVKLIRDYMSGTRNSSYDMLSENEKTDSDIDNKLYTSYNADSIFNLLLRVLEISEDRWSIDKRIDIRQHKYEGLDYIYSLVEELNKKLKELQNTSANIAQYNSDKLKEAQQTGTESLLRIINLEATNRLADLLNSFGSYYSYSEGKYKYYATKSRVQIEQAYRDLKTAIAFDEGLDSAYLPVLNELKEIIDNLGVIALGIEASPLYFSLNFFEPTVNVSNLLRTLEQGSEPTTNENIQKIVEDNIQKTDTEQILDSHYKIQDAIISALKENSITGSNLANKKKDFEKLSVAKGIIAIPDEAKLDTATSTGTYYDIVKANGGLEQNGVVWFTNEFNTLEQTNDFLPVALSVYGKNRPTQQRTALINHIKQVVANAQKNVVFITDTRQKAMSSHNEIGEGVVWNYLYNETNYVPVEINQMTVWVVIEGSLETKTKNDKIFIATPETIKDEWGSFVAKSIKASLNAGYQFSPSTSSLPELNQAVLRSKQALINLLRVQSQDLGKTATLWKRLGISEKQREGSLYLTNYLNFLNQQQSITNLDSLKSLTDNIAELSNWMSSYIQVKDIDGVNTLYWSDAFMGEDPALDLNNNLLIATLGRDFERTSVEALNLIDVMLNEVVEQLVKLESKSKKTDADILQIAELKADKASLEESRLVFTNLVKASENSKKDVLETQAELIKFKLVDQRPISKYGWFYDTLTANVSGALKRSSIIQMFARLEKEVLDKMSQDFTLFDRDFMSNIKPLFDKVSKEKQAKLFDAKGKRLIGQGTKQFYDEVSKQLIVFKGAGTFNAQREKALRKLLEIADITYNEVDMQNYRLKEQSIPSRSRSVFNPAMIAQKVANFNATGELSYFNPEFVTFVPKQQYSDESLAKKYVNTKFNEVLQDEDLANIYNVYTAKMQELYYKKDRTLRTKYMSDKHLFVPKFPKSSVDYFTQKDRRGSWQGVNNAFDQFALNFTLSGVDDPTVGHRKEIDTKTKASIYDSQQHFTVPQHGIYDIGIPEGDLNEDLAIALYQFSVNSIAAENKERAEPMFKYIYSSTEEFVDLKGKNVTNKQRATEILRADLQDRMNVFLYDVPMNEVQDVTGKTKYLSNRQKRYVQELKSLIDEHLANLMTINPATFYDTSIQGVTDYTTLDVPSQLIPIITERFAQIDSILTDQTAQISIEQRNQLFDERAELTIIANYAEKYARTGEYLTPASVGIAVTNGFKKAMQTAYLSGNIRNILLEPLEILQEMFVYASDAQKRTALFQALFSAIALEVNPKARSKFNRKFSKLEDMSGISSLFTNAKNLAKIRIGSVSNKIDVYANSQAFFAGQRLADHVVRRTLLFYALQEIAVDVNGNPIVDEKGVVKRWLDVFDDNGTPLYGADVQGFQRTILGMTPMVTSEGSRVLTARDRANWLFSLASTMRGFMISYMLKRFKPRAYYDFLDKVKDQNNPEAYDMGRWRWLFTQVDDIADPSKDKLFRPESTGKKAAVLIAATVFDLFGAGIGTKDSYLVKQFGLSEFDVKMLNMNKKNLWTTMAYYAMYQLFLQGAIAAALGDDDEDKSWQQQVMLLGANIFNRATTESWIGLDTHTLLAPRNVYQQAQLSTLIPFWDYARDVGMLLYNLGGDIGLTVQGKEIPMTTKGAKKGEQTETARMFDKVFFPGLINSNIRALNTKPKETAVERQWENLTVDSELSEQEDKKKSRKRTASRSLD